VPTDLKEMKMNNKHPDAGIEAMRIAADAASSAHDIENERLKALGQNAKVRYPALQQLRDAKNATHAAYHSAATDYVKRGLDKIIRDNKRAGVKPVDHGFVVDELHGKIRLTK
jgi:hypothetical protein